MKQGTLKTSELVQIIALVNNEMRYHTENMDRNMVYHSQELCILNEIKAKLLNEIKAKLLNSSNCERDANYYKE